MRAFSKNFLMAVADYKYLFLRGYPMKPVHGMISTRYALSSAERSMLYRGIAFDHYPVNLVSEPGKNEQWYIDTWNVVLTIYSYLLGLPVYIGEDGMVRDTAEAHSVPENDGILTKTLHLIIDYLDTTAPEKVSFYLDDKMGGNSSVIREMSIKWPEDKKAPDYKISGSVDHDLARISEGLIATSDSQVIRRAATKVIDLPKQLLEKYFQPKLPDLRKI